MENEKGVYLYGYNPILEVWQKLLLDRDGRLKVSADIERLRIPPAVLLINTGQQIDQGDLSASQRIRVADGWHTGFIRVLNVKMVERGSGAALTNGLTFHFFDEDPRISSGDTVITAEQLRSHLGKITITSADYRSYTSTAFATVEKTFPYRTNDRGEIWISVENDDATAFNSAAGDDEELSVLIAFQRLDQ